MTETIQYILVFLIIIGAAIAVAIKLIHLRKKGKFDACCGCTLADSCNKQKLKKNNLCDENNQNME